MATSFEAIDRNAPSELDAALARLFASEPAAMADPFPLWKRLREEAPIHDHGHATLVSRAHTIKKLINDPRATHNSYGRGRRAEAARAALPAHAQAAFDEVTAFEAMYMSRNDGEPHDRLRRIAQRTFTPRRIQLIGELVERLTEQYLDELAAQPRPDFKSFAYRLPLKVIGEMLSIPEQDLDQVHEWSNKLGRNRGGTQIEPLMEAHRALGQFRAYVEQRIEALRDRPRSGEELDLLGDLLDANQGEALSDAELAAMFVVLLFAGHETTTNLVGTGLYELLRTGEWQKLLDDPARIPRAVEELVRFVTPVQWLGRNIEAPIEADGHVFMPGETVFLILAAGNRDPDLFDQPDRLDVMRENAQFHLGFGRGGHICLGSHLARMEAIAAFTAIARRFPDIRLADQEVTWRGHALLRGLSSLHVDLGPERTGQ